MLFHIRHFLRGHDIPFEFNVSCDKVNYIHTAEQQQCKPEVRPGRCLHTGVFDEIMADKAHNASAEQYRSCKGADIVNDKLPENYLVQFLCPHAQFAEKLIAVFVFSGI